MMRLILKPKRKGEKGKESRCQGVQGAGAWRAASKLVRGDGGRCKGEIVLLTGRQAEGDQDFLAGTTGRDDIWKQHGWS